MLNGSSAFRLRRMLLGLGAAGAPCLWLAGSMPAGAGQLARTESDEEIGRLYAWWRDAHAKRMTAERAFTAALERDGSRSPRLRKLCDEEMRCFEEEAEIVWALRDARPRSIRGAMFKIQAAKTLLATRSHLSFVQVAVDDLIGMMT